MPFIVDTYAWIEYFRGTEVGGKIKSKIEVGRNITPTVVIAELSKRFTDLGRSDLEEKISFIKTKGIVLPLSESEAVTAGYIRSTTKIKDMGIVDCILLSIARERRIKILTGDRHFKNVEEADYFGV